MNHPGTPKNGGADYSPLPPIRTQDVDPDLYPISPTSPNLRGGYQDFHPDNTVPYAAPPENLGGPSSPYINVAPSSPYSSSHHLPSGAAQPRFLSSAMYQDMPGDRNSFASSQHTFNSGNYDANSSVYGLQQNPMREQGYFGRFTDQGASFAGSDQALRMSEVGQPRYLTDKRSMYASPAKKSKRKLLLWGGLGVLVLVAAAVGLGLILRPKGGSKSSSPEKTSPAGPKATGTAKPTSAITGGDGSLITLSDGTTYTYKNSFGGYWYSDPSDPFNNAARAQSWSPALNETFNYGDGVHQIWGVNLGGWLTLEPFVSPALFQKYSNNNPAPIDEWTLSEAMAADTSSGGGLQQIENHYKTFITEQDFAEIAGAGLNFVRIPLPWWAIETRTGEPFLPKTAWTYFLKAIQWARKYGIRINLDLHALPGSQNGWNHSGRLGTINVLNGPMGIANAQRALDYIRILTEFISQPQYKDVVVMFGITNEPLGPTIGQDALARYYLKAHDIIRTVTGFGQGNGPMISIHDGFLGVTQWAGFYPNSDRVALDYHPYLCFDGQSSAPIASFAGQACSTWGGVMNTSMGAFGLTAAGEFSNAVNDCGLFLNGVNLGNRYDGTYVNGGPWPVVGSCKPWNDWQNYNPALKTGLNSFVVSSMSALQNWFFWTWKIGNSSTSGLVEAPLWSYKLGYDNGWIPKDPRVAIGVCDSTKPWQPPLQPWQTGGAGAGQIPASVSAKYAWPPASISGVGGGGVVAALPTYTPTGPVPTLPGPTFTATPTPNVGNGWVNPADTAGLMVNAAGCKYLDPWVGSAAPPSPLCGG